MLIATGICGGLGHILLTESYRRAAASLIAPFDYTSMLWTLLLGFILPSEAPSLLLLAGVAVIAAAGLLVIWRERQLGAKRRLADSG
jgi:drug/metabolite transporter (DMT)-like permease